MSNFHPRDTNEQLEKALHAAISRKATEDQLLRMLEDELKLLSKKNKEKLESRSEILSIYRMIKSSLTACERDQLFLSLLDSVKGIADNGRQGIRSILREHIKQLDYVKKKYMESLE